MILIITSKRDSHIGAVSRHLTQAGAKWVRINIEDFATNVDVEIEPTKGTGVLRLKDSGQVVSLNEVGAVWYRKPDPVVVQHFDLDAAALDYVEAEFNEIIHGLYALLSRAYWINDPFSIRIAHRKLLQLKTAVDVGFAVPTTIVTNKPASAISFAKSVGGDLALKSLGAISVIADEADKIVQYGIFTRRISHDELSEFGDKIGHMPTLLQEFIPKKWELRITCVGNDVFACQIQTREGDITSDDYRFDTSNLEHTAVECPELASRMHAYMKFFGMNFGCFDFIVPEHGEPVFLECNCNGQWLWVENLTGQPIGLAIARQLLQHATVGKKIESHLIDKTNVERKSRIHYQDITGSRMILQPFIFAGESSEHYCEGDQQVED